MPQYLIAFNDEWVPEHTHEQLIEKRDRSLAVLDDAAARQWAGRLAVALDWPQEVHGFPGMPE